MALRVRLVFDRIPEVKSELVARVSQAVEASAIAIEQDVKGGGPHAAPYVTGNLRRSYFHQRENDLTYVVGNDAEIAPYAIYVEFGTHRARAKPHLGPAAEAERPVFRRRVVEALKDLR